MNRQFFKEAFVWGFILWFIGYILGIVLFPLAPTAVIGWIIMPIGTLVTLWVLVKKIKQNNFKYYLLLGFVWMLIAIVSDYFLLVKLFKPADGYYKLDVYLYYLFTFLYPVLVAWRKNLPKNS